MGYQGALNQHDQGECTGGGGTTPGVIPLNLAV